MTHKRAMRLILAMALGLFGFFHFAGVASAQNQCNPQPAASGGPSTATSEDTCTNEGDADAAADQSGSASTGDGVAGQVAGVVSAGDASVDATNRSDDVDVETGSAEGTNSADTFATAAVFGAAAGANTCEPNPTATNPGDEASNGNTCVQSGDADAAADQSADAASGDGVGGQVIGVVTSAGGSADLVLDNESTDSDVLSGDGEFTNDSNSDSDAVVFAA